MRRIVGGIEEGREWGRVVAGLVIEVFGLVIGLFGLVIEGVGERCGGGGGD